MMQAIAPSTLPHGLASKNWLLIWGGIATALSWVLTGLLAAYMMVFQGFILKAFRKYHQIKYVGIIAMLVESTGLLSSFTMFFMIAYSAKSPSLVMVPFLLMQIQVSFNMLGDIWAVILIFAQADGSVARLLPCNER